MHCAPVQSIQRNLPASALAPSFTGKCTLFAWILLISFFFFERAPLRQFQFPACAHTAIVFHRTLVTSTNFDTIAHGRKLTAAMETDEVIKLVDNIYKVSACNVLVSPCTPFAYCFANRIARCGVVCAYSLSALRHTSKQAHFCENASLEKGDFHNNNIATLPTDGCPPSPSHRQANE